MIINNKIGIVIDRLNVGGVEKIAIEQVRSLREIGEDAYLVVLRRKGVVDDAFIDLRRNLPTIFLDDRLPDFLKQSIKFPIFHFFSSFHITYPFLIPFVVNKNEFDYLIVHGTYTCFTAVMLKKIKKIHFSAYIWDPISYILNRVYGHNFFDLFLTVLKRIALYLDKIIIDNVDYILVGGTAHNALLKKINPKKNIKVIYPSVHPIKKQTKKEEYILMVTAWKEGKDPEYILQIISNLPEANIKMVGKWLDVEYKRKFQKFLKVNNIAKQISIEGEVSEVELKQFYSHALVLLQTNDDRGFGMPALEAAGHGTTFIIPDGQGVCNLFKNNVDGFFTKEKDTQQICKYLTILLNNKEIAIKMGQSSLQNVQKNYSWKKHAEALKAIYTK